MVVDEQFEQLLSRYCDDSATEEEVEQLNQLLRDDPDARKQYLLYLGVHASMMHRSKTVSIAPLTCPASRPKPRLRKLLFLLPLAAAAGIALAFLTRPTVDPGKSQMISRVSDSFPLAAPIERSRSVVWGGELTGDRTFVEMDRSRLLTSGVVVVDHPSARLTIEGPAEFTLRDKHVELASGRILAAVHEGVDDFQIVTQHGRFLDVGTTFGVAATPDQATCHVFDGAVYVSPSDQPAPADRTVLQPTLTAGVSANFSDGLIDSLRPSVKFDQIGFARKLPERHGVALLRGQIELVDAFPEGESARDTPDVLLRYEGHFELNESLPVDLIGPGAFVPKSKSRASLPAGTRIHSYLARYIGPQTKKGGGHRSGGITFDGKIVGVAFSERAIGASLPVMGNFERTPEDRNSGGIETGDFVTVSDDSYSVKIGFTASYVDAIRIYLAAPAQ